jgi:hypothetical protein
MNVYITTVYQLDLLYRFEWWNVDDELASVREDFAAYFKASSVILDGL